MTEFARLLTAGVAAIGQALADGEVTAADLTEAALSAIAAADPELNAFITVDAEGARAAAAAADQRAASGQRRQALHGVPVAVKDNIPTAGLRTTYNSRAYAGWIPATDAPAVTRLRRAGASW